MSLISANLKSNLGTLFYLLIALLCMHHQGLAQQLNYKVGTLNNTNISQNIVSSVLVDSTGVLWFGKIDGLYKYNGYDIDVIKPDFRTKNGLSNPWVTDIKDIKDYLVIGTKNGLNFLNKNTQVITHFFPLDFNASYDNNIVCIDTVSKNEILLALTNKLLRIKLEKGGGFKIKEVYANTIDNKKIDIGALQIINVPEGKLIRSNRGVFYLEKSVQTAKKVTFSSDDTGELKSINTLYLTKEKQVLISAGGSEYFVSMYSNPLRQNLNLKVKPLSQWYINWPKIKIVNIFLEDFNGNIWAGTDGQGLFVYNIQAEDWQNYSHKMYSFDGLENDYVKALYQDPSGMMFVGTEGGINTLISEENSFQLIKNIKNKDEDEEILNVQAILQDTKKNLWLGTRGRGIFFISEDKKHQVAIKNTGVGSIDIVLAIIQDKKQHIWIATGKGIFIVKKLDDNLRDIDKLLKSKKPDILHNEYVYRILEDKNENKWISTSKGLYIYTNNGHLKMLSNKIGWKKLKGEIIYSLMLDSQQRIWFSGSNGVKGYLNPENYVDKDLSQAEILEAMSINSIHVVPKFKKFFENYAVFTMAEIDSNQILMGTNLGLCKVDIDKNELSPFFDSISSYDEKSVQTSQVYGLLQDNKNNMLWASTNNGLFSYDFKNKKEENYTLKDGLQSLEFNANSVYKSINGKLFFGGANGINIYDTSHILKKDKFQSKLILTKLFVNGHRVFPYDDSKILKENISNTKKIELDSKMNNIGLEFASLHLPYSLYNLYKCKLQGVDTDWIDLGQKRSINYVNLPKGEYTFQLMATNNDGVWNTEELNFGIEILPAWYEIWWMKTLWYLCTLLIISAFIWILLKNRDNINTLKIKEIERKKLHEIYESKLVFFTNLSHEFRTPLSLILDPIHSLIKQKSIYNSNKDLFDIVKNNVDRLRRLIDQIMDFRKFEYGKLSLNFSEGDIVTTLKNISASFTYYSKVKNIDFKIQFPEKGIFMFYDQDSIEKIVYNLLSNGFKATTNGGEVKISMGELNEQNTLFRYKLICGEKNYKNLTDHIYIKVQDNGIGITKKNLEEVFTRFYQDEGIDSGTGIGLYMVKQFTEMHYGSILIKSKKNKGTSLIIVLPKNNDIYKPSKEINLTKTNLDPNKPELSEIIEQNLLPTKSGNYTIVVVEDNDELRAYLKLILSNYYNVYTANNGLEGIALIQEENPDLIISDIVMPEISGLELCKKIKGDFETSHIPIILLTAKSFDNQVVDGIDSGADAYITKPFNKDILVSKINNLIQSREKLRLIFQNAQLLEPSKITVTSIDEKLLHKLKQTVEEKIQDQNLTLEILAEEINVSRAQLFRKIKALTGLTPNNFVKSIRIKYAAQLLENENFQMAEIAFLSGFKEASYFSRCFKEAYGCSPKEYKNSDK